MSSRGRNHARGRGRGKNRAVTAAVRTVANRDRAHWFTPPTIQPRETRSLTVPLTVRLDMSFTNTTIPTNTVLVPASKIIGQAMTNIGMTSLLWGSNTTFRLFKLLAYLPVGQYESHGVLPLTLGIYGLDFQDFKGDRQVVGTLVEPARVGYEYPEAQKKIVLKNSANTICRVSVDLTGEPADVVFRVQLYCYIVFYVFDENPVNSFSRLLVNDNNDPEDDIEEHSLQKIRKRNEKLLTGELDRNPSGWTAIDRHESCT